MKRTDDEKHFYRLDRAARRLSILDAETLEEVGFVQVPEKFTLADLERFRLHLVKLAKRSEELPS